MEVGLPGRGQKGPLSVYRQRQSAHFESRHRAPSSQRRSPLNTPPSIKLTAALRPAGSGRAPPAISISPTSDKSPASNARSATSQRALPVASASTSSPTSPLSTPTHSNCSRSTAATGALKTAYTTFATWPTMRTAVAPEKALRPRYLPVCATSPSVCCGLTTSPTSLPRYAPSPPNLTQSSPC